MPFRFSNTVTICYIKKLAVLIVSFKFDVPKGDPHDAVPCLSFKIDGVITVIPMKSTGIEVDEYTTKFSVDTHIDRFETVLDTFKIANTKTVRLVYCTHEGEPVDYSDCFAIFEIVN